MLYPWWLFVVFLLMIVFLLVVGFRVLLNLQEGPARRAKHRTGARIFFAAAAEFGALALMALPRSLDDLPGMLTEIVLTLVMFSAVSFILFDVLTMDRQTTAIRPRNAAPQDAVHQDE